MELSPEKKKAIDDKIAELERQSILLQKEYDNIFKERKIKLENIQKKLLIS